MRMPLNGDSVQRGWLDAEEVCTLAAEIGRALHAVREEMRALLGEAEAETFYRAGASDGGAFAQEGLRLGHAAPDASGFRRVLEQYARCGLGQCEVIEEDWARGEAVVEAAHAFEGESYVRAAPPQTTPRCDYARGALAAFLRETRQAAGIGPEDIAAVETHCIAQGDACCRFLLGPPARLAERGHALSLASYDPGQTLRLQQRSLAVLNEIAAHETDDPIPLLDFALTRVLRLLGLNIGRVRLLTEDGAGLLLVAHRGRGPARSVLQTVLPVEGSIVGEAVRTGRPVVSEDLASSEAGRELAAAGIRALAAVPLRSRTQTLGVFVVATQGARTFSSQEIEFLTAAARQIGIRVENARLLETVQRHSRLMEEAVDVAAGELRARNEELTILNAIATTVGGSLNLQQILRAAGQKVLELVGYDGFAVYLTDRPRCEIRLALSLGKGSGTVRRIGRAVAFGEGFAGRVSESGQPIFASNFDDVANIVAHPALLKLGVKTFASIPLRAHDRVVGVLDLSSGKRREISAGERRILEAVGNLLGVAVENAQLYERTRARVRQERLENAIASQLRRSLDTHDIFETAVRELCRALRASRCFLSEIEGDIAVVSHEFRRENVPAVPTTFRLDDFSASLLEQAIRGHALAIEDVATNPFTALHYQKLFAPLRTRSTLLVPLIVGGQWRAVLTVSQCDRKRVWTPDDIALAQSVANHTALAVENARLFERTRRSEQEYQTLYDEAPDMYLTLDASERITQCNATQARTLGYEKSEMIDRHWSEFCTPEAQEALFEEVADILGRPWRTFTTETQILHKDGSPLDVAVRAIPIWQEGEIVGARVVMRDNTAQKRLERQLIQAQKMESLGTLAGGIAHDFNNLLTGMIGYATLIKRSAAPDESLYKYADTIEKSGQRAAELTHQMLAFARSGELHAQPVNLNDVVRETVSLLTHSLEKQIVIETNLAEDLLYVQADSAQMQQVVLNLCVNARDAMPEGGKLTITTRNEWTEAVACSNLRKSGLTSCVELSVSDTGHGMDDQTRARIFDPFFTTKAPGKGTGLGLAMVYGILSHHSGHVEVESKVGEGAAFHLYLPALRRAAPHCDMEDDTLAPLRWGRLLIVDDEPVVRTLLHDLLTGRGMTAHSVGSGREAVEFYRAHGGKIDLILMDMMMPEMDGREAFWQMRAMNPSARILLMSGYSEDAVVETLLQAGARGFLPKPCPAGELLAAVRQALE